MTKSGTRFSSGGYYVCKIPATGNSLAKVLEAIGTMLGLVDTVPSYRSRRAEERHPAGQHRRQGQVQGGRYHHGLARSLEHFSWPDLGLLFLDGDGIDGLFELVSGLYPPFAEVGVLAPPSAPRPRWSIRRPGNGSSAASICYCVADDPSLRTPP